MEKKYIYGKIGSKGCFVSDVEPKEDGYIMLKTDIRPNGFIISNNGEWVQQPFSYSEKRKNEYEKQGLTIESLTVALIEANAGNLADLAIIQEKRAKIKNDIPKD